MFMPQTGYKNVIWERLSITCFWVCFVEGFQVQQRKPGKFIFEPIFAFFCKPLHHDFFDFRFYSKIIIF